MTALYSYFDDESEAIDITPADIAACTDVDELKAWDDGLEELAEDIKGQIEGVSLADIADGSWIWRATQKLGWVNRGRAKVRRRIRELGHDTSTELPAFERLRVEHARLKSESTVALHFLRIAETTMIPAEFAKIAAEATRKADEIAAERKAFFKEQSDKKRFAA